MSIGLIGLILIGLFVAAALVAMFIVGLGFALGWFRMGAGRVGTRREVAFALDADKIREDETILRERVVDVAYRETMPNSASAAIKRDAAAPSA
jgi:hypothetical protein